MAFTQQEGDRMVSGLLSIILLGCMHDKAYSLGIYVDGYGLIDVYLG